MDRKLLIIAAIAITAVFMTTKLMTAMHQTTTANTTILYDGKVGGTPDTQKLIFAAIDPTNPFFPADAT